MSQIPYLWCRVEEQSGRVTRVNVMHPNGEILFSYPPDHFDAGLVLRMQAGQIRARISESGGHLALLDDSDDVVATENVPLRPLAVPRDHGER